MNLGRRVVLSLVLASALAVIAGTVSHIVVDGADGGWFMYEPNGNGIPFAAGDSNGDALRVAAVWLIAIALWSASKRRIVTPAIVRSWPPSVQLVHHSTAVSDTAVSGIGRHSQPRRPVRR